MFEIHQGIVIPIPETLLISPFKEIWERDPDKDKHSKAMKEFAYIEFMCSYRKENPFIGMESYERHSKICQQVMKDIKYIPDELVLTGMEVYKDIEEKGSVELRYLKSLEDVANKTINWARGVDFSETDVQGRLKYNVKDVIRMTSDAGDILKNIADTRKRVQQQLYESSKTRGNREPGHYEKRPLNK